MVKVSHGLGHGLATNSKLGCYCEEYHCFSGYDHTYGDEGTAGLPKCEGHRYCFCSGGARDDDCERCIRIHRLRVEGLEIYVEDGGVCQAVNESIGRRYSNYELIQPNCAFVKAYRRYMAMVCKATRAEVPAAPTASTPVERPARDARVGQLAPSTQPHVIGGIQPGSNPVLKGAFHSEFLCNTWIFHGQVVVLSIFGAKASNQRSTK